MQTVRFKVGDKVKCINNIAMTGKPMALVEGDIYTVKEVTLVRKEPARIELKEVEGKWRLDRFEVVSASEQFFDAQPGLERFCMCNKWDVYRDGCKCGAIVPYKSSFGE